MEEEIVTEVGEVGEEEEEGEEEEGEEEGGRRGGGDSLVLTKPVVKLLKSLAVRVSRW